MSLFNPIGALAGAWASSRQPRPEPEAPRPLFTLEGIRYEALRELTRLRTGEVVLLARYFPEHEGSRSTPCLVRRLFNPASATRRTRLLEEVRQATGLRHPAIGQVLHHKVHQGALHVVQEYVDGPALDTLLRAVAARRRPVSEAFALHVGSELAGALHHAHTQVDADGKPLRILHRDVNPRHVHVGAAGEVKLMNFGASYSLVLGRAEAPMSLSREDVAYASPEYLEQWRLTPASDVFSLGVLLVELFTGRALFQVRDVPPPPAPPDLPASSPLTQMRVRLADFGPQDVEAVVKRLSWEVKQVLHLSLRLEPRERIAMAKDIRDVLRAALVKRHPGYGPPQAAVEAARIMATSRWK
jgi:eukaryotic-like serine/threonine-protein kinase